MISKTIVFRARAETDAREATEYYRANASERVMLAFVEALEAAYDFVASTPSSGSPRYGALLDISGLRGWSLRRFPYIVFYIEHDDRIDVLRVVHAHRDISSSLIEPSDDVSDFKP